MNVAGGLVRMYVPAARVLLILAVHLVGGLIWGTSCEV